MGRACQAERIRNRKCVRLMEGEEAEERLEPDCQGPCILLDRVMGSLEGLEGGVEHDHIGVSK